MGRLIDKIVFITGIAGGQGRAAAQLFAREGAHVIGCDIKEADAAETVAMVRDEGGKIDNSIVDLTDFEAASRWIENGVATAGRIDVLYNNAGNPTNMAPIWEQTLEHWTRTIHGELDIIFNTIRPAWSHLADRGGGAIINTASVAAHRGYAEPGGTAHSAAKGGVTAFTKQLAAEGAPFRIRANSISPGGG